MSTTTLEQPAKKVDPRVEAIPDVEGLPQTATASDIEPAVKTVELAPVAVPGKVEQATTPRLTSHQVWAEVGKASFAIVSHVTPAGEPRSSGVVYAEERHHLYVAVAPDGWKARQIADDQQVAVTIPVRRGGPLSLLLPIPPATISFHARAIAHPAGSLDLRTVSKKLLAAPSEGSTRRDRARTRPGGRLPDVRDRRLTQGDDGSRRRRGARADHVIRVPHARCRRPSACGVRLRLRINLEG